MGMKYYTEAGVECTPEECKLYIKSIIIFIPFNEIVYMAYVGRSSCQLIQFIRHDNFQRPYFVGFGRQNSITIVRGIMKKIYICIHE